MAERIAAKDALLFEEIEDSDSSAFRSFYALYEAAFPLADEREPPEAFDAILSLNANAAVQAAYGPYREVVAAIRECEGGPIMGGHIFGIATSEPHCQAGIGATVQGIYTFLHPDARGAVPIARLVAYCREAAARTFPQQVRAAAPAPILFEVNNPLRMSQAQIDLDTRSSGTDPYRRYHFWTRCGFRPLDFQYKQPRLRSDAAAIDYLDLFCTRDLGLTSFPADVLERHLHAFISVSVLKGRDANDDAEFAQMRRWLDAHPVVRFKSDRSPESELIAGCIRKMRKEQR